MPTQQSIKSLLNSYNPKKIKKVKKLKFAGVEGRDVYNVTAPFRVKRTLYILGRVEPRIEEAGTQVMFFRRPKHSRQWHIDYNCPIFDLQDPFVIKLKDMFIVGGVEIKQRSIKKTLSFRTVFYKGKTIPTLKRFAHGPWGMKGIRFTPLPNGKVGLFTRPQGKKGRRGKIGFTIIDSLSKLTTKTLYKAEIIQGQFARGEWGGVNEIHYLKNGKIGILGHIAKFTRGKTRWYYPIIFTYDPEMGMFSRFKIIARRADIPKGEAKRMDLYNVVYPGGIIRNKNNTAKLYIGVGDAEAYEITMDDPFLEYEEDYELL